MASTTGTRTNRVGEILVKNKLVDALQMRSALARHDQWGGRLAKIVADLGFASEDAIVDAVARELFLKRVQLGHIAKDLPALRKLDSHYCEEHAVFPVSLKDNGKTLVLAMADPTDLHVVDEVAMKARARVLVMCAGEREIQAAISRYYHDGKQTHSPEGPRRATLEQPSIDLEPDAFQGNQLVLEPRGGGSREERMLDPALFDAPEPTENQRSAGSLLEEILAPAREPEVEAFGPEERARLEAVRGNQEKSGLILKALIDLLEQKGALAPGELQSRTRI